VSDAGKPVVENSHYIPESGVITKVALEACAMPELSEVCLLGWCRLSGCSMDPAMSASIVNVFPNPIS
jgi:hypothetical protein